MPTFRCSLPLLTVLGALGCQQYAPSPIDLPEHHRGVEARDAATEDVKAYARRVARQATVVATYDPADGLSIAEAEIVALYFNPQLRVARLKAKVPLVGAAEAGRWEDPELVVDGERIIESVDKPWVLGASINFTIPLSGRLGVEREKALAEAEVEKLRAFVEEQELLADLRAAWLEWSATRERLDLAERVNKELDQLVESAEKLRAAGELDRTDARLFRIQRVTHEGQLRSLRAEANSQEVGLKAMLGLAARAEVRLLPSLSGVRSPPGSSPHVEPAAQVHPRLRLTQAEYAVAERALKLEIRKQYPDLNLGGGFGTDEGEERVLFGLAVPLPILNRNRRAIAEARASRDVAKATAEAVYDAITNEVAEASLAVEAARARVAFIEGELAPLVDEQLAELRRLGRLGDFNTLVLLEAVNASNEAKLQVIDGRLKLALAASSLDALVSPSLTPAPVPRRDEE